MESLNMFHCLYYLFISVEGVLPLSGLKEYTFNDIERSTGGFRKVLSTSEGTDVNVYKGWVDQDTLAPSNHVYGTAVAVVRRVSSESPLEYTSCLVSITKQCIFVGFANTTT